MNKYYEKNKFISFMEKNNYRIFYKHKIAKSNDLESYGITFINNLNRKEISDIIFTFYKYEKTTKVTSKYKDLPEFIKNIIINKKNIKPLIEFKEILKNVNIDMDIYFAEVNINLKYGKIDLSFEYGIKIENFSFIGNSSFDSIVFFNNFIKSEIYYKIVKDPELRINYLTNNYKLGFFELINNSISLSKIIDY